MNKRFAPKSKSINQPNQELRNFCHIQQFNHDLQNLQNYDPQNNPKLEGIQYHPVDSFRKSQTRSYKQSNPIKNMPISHFVKDKNQSQEPINQTKTRMTNLRDSIESLQKIVCSSRQVLNDSIISNSYSNRNALSPKTKIKSDFVSIQFNLSTKKINQRASQTEKIKLLSSSKAASYLQSVENLQQKHRQNLLQESINKTKNIKIRDTQNSEIYDLQNSINRMANENIRKNHFYVKEGQKQFQTNSQLNSTLEKLLNQSFESTGNGTTLQLSTNNTIFASHSPRSFKMPKLQLIHNKQNERQSPLKFNFFPSGSKQKDHKKKLNNLLNPFIMETTFDQSDRSQLIKNKRIIDHFDKQASFEQNDQNGHTFDQNFHSSEFILDSDKIFVQDDQIMQEQRIKDIKDLQIFSTKSKNLYETQSRMEESWQKTNEKLFKQKMTRWKKSLLRTPKAYKKYQLSKSLKKYSKSKDWFPKNFSSFQNNVLQSKCNQKVFKEKSHQGKFSSQLVSFGKENKAVQMTSNKEVNQNLNVQRQRQRKINFINDVGRNPIVERYLKKTEVLMIYDKLKKSKIPQKRWTLFVIDEVHKKMNQEKSRS